MKFNSICFYQNENPFEDKKFKYSKEANNNDNHGNRQKRATRVEFPQAKSVCSLYLKVDPFYYNQIFNAEGNKVAHLKYFNSNLFHFH